MPAVLSAVHLVDPFILHTVNPVTVVAVGAGLVSAATVTAVGLMGRWFTRMEREARAEDPCVPGTAAQSEATPSGLSTIPDVLNPPSLEPAASMPLASIASTAAPARLEAPTRPEARTRLEAPASSPAQPATAFGSVR